MTLIEMMIVIIIVAVAATGLSYGLGALERTQLRSACMRVTAGARYACVGDAACFIDPVFSSGVTLAVQGARHIAEVLVPALEAGRESDPELMKPIEARVQRGYDTFAALVYRWYNTHFVDNMIFGAPDEGDMRAGVISVLAGDVFRDGNPFQDLLLSSRRHRPLVSDELGEDASGADVYEDDLLR